MSRYLLRRLLIVVPSILGISIVLFTVLALAPGDPFEELASNPNVPPEVGAGAARQVRARRPDVRCATCIGSSRCCMAIGAFRSPAGWMSTR